MKNDVKYLPLKNGCLYRIDCEDCFYGSNCLMRGTLDTSIFCNMEEISSWITKGFNFHYDYFKLKETEFTTIRGKMKFRKYLINQIVKITLKNNYFGYYLIKTKETKQIKDISLDFLKKDTEYPSFEIQSHQDFINLINSFRVSYYEQASLDSFVTIFYLINVRRVLI